MASLAMVADTLTAPLESLVVTGDRAGSAAVVEEWALPAEGRAALLRWGLPQGLVLYPELQEVSDPTLTPNVSSDRERALVEPDQRLYRLGWWGPKDIGAAVGAVAGTGKVLGIRDRSLGAEDLHPDLRRYNPNFTSPAVFFINSSVEKFVEVCWRWYAAVRILREIDEPNGAQYLDFVESEMRVRRQFLEGIMLVDAGIDAESSVWAEAVLES